MDEKAIRPSKGRPWSAERQPCHCCESHTYGIRSADVKQGGDGAIDRLPELVSKDEDFHVQRRARANEKAARVE
jgi:hypothetical protein